MIELVFFGTEFVLLRSAFDNVALGITVVAFVMNSLSLARS